MQHSKKVSFGVLSNPAFCTAKYDVEGARKQKNDISKVVAQKKKDSKG